MTSSSKANRFDPHVAAHLLGATALTLVCLFAIDMPEGFLGPTEKLSSFGFWYAIALTTVTAAIVVLSGRGELPRFAALAVMACNIGVFVPALPADPVVGVLVVGWNGTIMGIDLFGVRLRAGPWAELPVSTQQELPRSPYRAASVHLVIVGMLLALLVVGYGLTTSPLPLTIAAVGTLAPAGYALLRMARRGAIWTSAAISVGLLGAAFVTEPTTLIAAAAVANGVIIMEDVWRGVLFRELLHTFMANPAMLIIVTFAALVAVGALLLTLPAASATGIRIAPIDALFTAASAACVTGLIVLDTPVDFSPFGQAVIFGLFQVGGLGIMVLSTFATLLLGSRLGLRGERALGEVLDIREPASAYRLVKVVVATTLLVEGVGAVFLTYLFHDHGRDWASAAWAGIFHAVSAFCNAGFSLYSDSLISFENDPRMLVTHMALIVIGGIGFVVVAALWRRYIVRESRRLDLHTRVVLWTTVMLLVVGFVAFGALEWNGALGITNATDGTRVWNAAFQSVTFRTAGFNSVPYDNLGSATLFVMLLLMFIGASPGSTGGGIKTTTFAVLVAAVRGILRGRPVAEMFGREVPQEIVYRSAAIVVVSGGVLSVGLFVLFVTEPHIAFQSLAFEAFSAIATVGLSVGATGALSPAGKFVIVVMMFAGRVGPVTLALLLARRTKKAPQLPRATIMVG